MTSTTQRNIVWNFRNVTKITPVDNARIPNGDWLQRALGALAVHRKTKPVTMSTLELVPSYPIPSAPASSQNCLSRTPLQFCCQTKTLERGSTCPTYRRCRRKHLRMRANAANPRVELQRNMEKASFMNNLSAPKTKGYKTTTNRTKSYLDASNSTKNIRKWTRDASNTLGQRPNNTTKAQVGPPNDDTKTLKVNGIIASWNVIKP